MVGELDGKPLVRKNVEQDAVHKVPTLRWDHFAESPLKKWRDCSEGNIFFTACKSQHAQLAFHRVHPKRKTLLRDGESKVCFANFLNSGHVRSCSDKLGIDIAIRF